MILADLTNSLNRVDLARFEWIFGRWRARWSRGFALGPQLLPPQHVRKRRRLGPLVMTVGLAWAGDFQVANRALDGKKNLSLISPRTMIDLVILPTPSNSVLWSCPARLGCWEGWFWVAWVVLAGDRPMVDLAWDLLGLRRRALRALRGPQIGPWLDIRVDWGGCYFPLFLRDHF